jgi:hypothetical protein
MPVDPELRALNIDIPAQPESLVKLSMLLAEQEVNLQRISALIESDMALAAAVLKSVNSSLYGLSGRVQSVHQAITYLGTREVAAVTFEMGLRAVFPGAPELAPVPMAQAQRIISETASQTQAQVEQAIGPADGQWAEMDFPARVVKLKIENDKVRDKLDKLEDLADEAKR